MALCLGVCSLDITAHIRNGGTFPCSVFAAMVTESPSVEFEDVLIMKAELDEKKLDIRDLTLQKNIILHQLKRRAPFGNIGILKALDEEIEWLDCEHGREVRSRYSPHLMTQGTAEFSKGTAHGHQWHQENKMLRNASCASQNPPSFAACKLKSCSGGLSVYC